ncbi:MAG: TlpA family protein disulfide reductase [Pyrinomonadaceae bacterium]|nr:TlpA family protein disulfide reductase [Pyrinomonadaceae bacterium]
MRVFSVLAILLLSFVFASAQNEQAPLQEKEFEYKNWKYKGVLDSKEINLREFAKDKKLTLVVYFAPWCHNWKHQAPFVQKMYEKYKSAGLDVIGVGEYGTLEEMKNNLDFFKITFPVVYESLSSDDREKTKHYDYRKELGDTRKWGSPFNIFIEPANLQKNGDTVVKKAFIGSGELIEADAEKFIRQKLGLPAEEIKASNTKKEIEACEGDKKTVEFKKP